MKTFLLTFLLGLALLQHPIQGFCQGEALSAPLDLIADDQNVQISHALSIETTGEQAQLLNYLKRFNSGASFVQSLMSPLTPERSTLRPQLMKSLATGFARLNRDPDFLFTLDQAHKFFIHVLSNQNKRTGLPFPFHQSPSLHDIASGNIHSASVKFEHGPADRILIRPSRSFLGMGGKKRAVRAMLLWDWRKVAATLWKKDDGDYSHYFTQEGRVFDHLQSFPESSRVGIVKGLQYDSQAILMDLYSSDLTGYIPWSKASNKATLFEAILIGLRNLHRLGVSHSDLKPPNIFVRSNAETGKLEAVVGDFDVSFVREQLKVGEEIPNEGTTYYISPDRFQKSPLWPEDKESRDLLWERILKRDVFSLGVIYQGLYHLKGIPEPLTSATSGYSFNRKIYAAKYAEWSEQKLKKIKNSDRFDQMMILTLHPDPDKRPTVQELLDAFRPIGSSDSND